MRATLTVGCAVLLLAVAANAQDEGGEEGEEEDPLAALAELGDAVAEVGPEGGGSIRAKKEVDLDRSKRLKDKRNLEARVESVNKKRFPIVAVTIKVTKPAKDGAGKAVKKNDKMVVVPKLKVVDKNIAMTDADTLLNAGAFYLKKGDKVGVRLGTNKGTYWEADYIERK
ncbi:MAG: hypothetical protein V3T05_05870 [Myxococcota bacterium]